MQRVEILDVAGIAHGFFDRTGGVSSGIYASRNCGLGSNDARENVLANRASVAVELGTSPERLLTPYQIHSAQAVFVHTPWTPWETATAPRADALVTNVPGLAVAVLTADCGPVLFVDPEAGVVAAAHAGWRGALHGVLEATVKEMEKQGAQRTNIRAALGPMISRAAYEVGGEFREQFLKSDPESARFFHGEGPSSPHFDLPAYILHRLKRMGITKLSHLPHCTFADESRYFSYRRSMKRCEPDYGRQISAIMRR